MYPSSLWPWKLPRTSRAGPQYIPPQLKLHPSQTNFDNLENLVYHFFRQLWLVLRVKLMEINSNWFSRKTFLLASRQAIQVACLVGKNPEVIIMFHLFWMSPTIRIPTDLHREDLPQVGFIGLVPKIFRVRIELPEMYVTKVVVVSNCIYRDIVCFFPDPWGNDPI